MGEGYIDLNADLGESPGALASGADLDLMRFISSANIACGGHAGDESTMRQTLVAARDLNIAVGAHPGYPDRENFGRVAMWMSPEGIEGTVREQIYRLAKIANEFAMRLTHVKPHGALYHAARDRQVAEAIGRAVMSIDRQLVMVGQAGSTALEYWRDMGLLSAGEAFADRAYERDGTLRSRNLPGALLDKPALAAHQALEIALHRRVVTQGGHEMSVAAQTLCVHSDTPNASAIASAVRMQLTAAGVQVRPLLRPMDNCEER